MHPLPETLVPGGAAAAVATVLEDALAEVAPDARWVACSGGRDSMLLAALLAWSHRRRAWAPPRILHVHHGLHERAGDWAAFVRAQMTAWGLPVRLEQVDVVPTGAGPEGDARAARHRCFAAVLAKEEHLLCAHHRDDQVETVLLRLLRGAGPAGLAGMRPRRRLGAGWLTRPLLEVDGSLIAEAAQELELPWVEDPGNASLAFDRNHLRHRVLPQIAARWPGYRQTIARAARNCADESGQDAALRRMPGPLPVAELRDEGPAARLRLRSWLARHGVPAPSRRRLDELVRQAQAREDAVPCVAVGAWTVRRHDGRLHLVPAARPALPQTPLLLPAPGRLRLPHGELETRARRGGGVRVDLGPLELRFRSAAAGARARPEGRAHAAPLKRLLQDARIPPWERERIPLIYAAGDLVAIPGLWIDGGSRASGDAAGWDLCWRPDPPPFDQWTDAVR
jgi:tRNA(Ile)-lysidine synthase